MAQTVKVYIVTRDSEFLVVPPAVALTHNDSFQIVNLTDQDFEWSMGPEPFGAPIDHEPVKKGANPAKPVKTNKLLAFYSYELATKIGGKKARGNSDPIIIIDG